MKRNILLAVLFFLLFLTVFSGCAKKEETGYLNNSEVEKAIFFYSDSCSHCQKVKAYIKDNAINKKVFYREVAAFANQENMNLFRQKASECGLGEYQRGVPLVYSQGKCYLGDIEVIKFFKEEASKK